MKQQTGKNNPGECAKIKKIGAIVIRLKKNILLYL